MYLESLYKGFTLLPMCLNPGSFSSATYTYATFTKDLYVCDHEVTQDEYQTVMGTNPSNFKGNSNLPADGENQGNRPVEQVNWYDEEPRLYSGESEMPMCESHFTDIENHNKRVLVKRRNWLKKHE